MTHLGDVNFKETIDVSAFRLCKERSALRLLCFVVVPFVSSEDEEIGTLWFFAPFPSAVWRGIGQRTLYISSRHPDGERHLSFSLLAWVVSHWQYNVLKVKGQFAPLLSARCGQEDALEPPLCFATLHCKQASCLSLLSLSLSLSARLLARLRAINEGQNFESIAFATSFALPQQTRSERPQVKDECPAKVLVL